MRRRRGSTLSPLLAAAMAACALSACGGVLVAANDGTFTTQ
jgi:hypothetical protein